MLSCRRCVCVYTYEYVCERASVCVRVTAIGAIAKLGGRRQYLRGEKPLRSAHAHTHTQSCSDDQLGARSGSSSSQRRHGAYVCFLSGHKRPWGGGGGRRGGGGGPRGGAGGGGAGGGARGARGGGGRGGAPPPPLGGMVQFFASFPATANNPPPPPPPPFSPQQTPTQTYVGRHILVDSHEAGERHQIVQALRRQAPLGAQLLERLLRYTVGVSA